MTAAAVGLGTVEAALTHVRTTARIVRNTKGSEYVDERNAWIITARALGASTPTIAEAAQLAPSTVRGIRV